MTGGAPDGLSGAAVSVCAGFAFRLTRANHGRQADPAAHLLFLNLTPD
jgi:hypothetical protein